MALIACSHQQAPKVPDPNLATLTDCQHVYQHIITLTVVNEVDPGLTLSVIEEQVAGWEVDQTFQQNGKKDKFFSFCNTHMSIQQVACALDVSRVDDINTCIRMVK